MAKDKSKKSKKDKKSKKLSAKKAARAERLAKRKGDGSFPDTLVVTREKGEGKENHWFLGHNEDLTSIYKDGTVVGVYKLRRVSTVTIKRKVALNRG